MSISIPRKARWEGSKASLRKVRDRRQASLWFSQDVKGNKLAEQKTKEGGSFAFANLPPGQYVVVASKPTSGRRLTAKSNVDLAPGKTVKLTMNLFL